MEKKNMICEKAGLCTFVHCHNRTVHQKDEDCGLDTCSEFPEKVKCVEYSDPPSPDTTKLENQRYWDGVYDAIHGIVKYDLEHPKSDPPSPEPPEKVRETDKLLLTDEDFNQAWWDCYGEELPAIHGLVFGRTVRSRQILKLQLAGWGNLKEAQAENAKLKREIDSLIHDSD